MQHRRCLGAGHCHSLQLYWSKELCFAHELHGYGRCILCASFTVFQASHFFRKKNVRSWPDSGKLPSPFLRYFARSMIIAICCILAHRNNTCNRIGLHSRKCISPCSSAVSFYRIMYWRLHFQTLAVIHTPGNVLFYVSIVQSNSE